MEIVMTAVVASVLGAAVTYLVFNVKIRSLHNLMEEKENSHKALVEELKSNARKMEEAMRRQLEEERASWNEQKSQVQNSFSAMAGEILEKKSINLHQENRRQMEEMLRPLNERLKDLDTAVNETKKESAVNRNSLEIMVKDLMAKAETIGKDAVNLTHALKGNSKIQGDWGEMILEKMLEDSGLRCGEEYYRQENVKTDDGRNVRPDFIVRFPENRCVVIDSKVSLTAYTEYVSAENDQKRDMALKAHLASVRKHIDELAAVDYSRKVRDNIGYVLMFVPNEASYIVAVQSDPTLIQTAYKKKIILISPSNLMMALQMAYNLWQTDRQTRNVEEIVRRGNELYGKFAGFVDTFSKMDKDIDDLRKSYDAAYRQLVSGKGNVVRQFEMLRDLGLNPAKDITRKVLDEADE